MTRTAAETPDSTAPGPVAVPVRAVTTALMTGMPRVIPTCCVIVASPVARPCSVSGRPEVAVTMKPTIISMLPTPPTKVAASRSAIQPSEVPSATRESVAAAWTTPPRTMARRLPNLPTARPPSRPPVTVPAPSTPKASPVASGE